MWLSGRESGNWSGTAEAALLSLNEETEAFFIARSSIDLLQPLEKGVERYKVFSRGKPR